MPKGIYERRPETIEKLKRNALGSKHPHTEETKRKISITLRIKYPKKIFEGRYIGIKIRKLSEYKIWRETVFRRDDFTCQICKKRGGRLEPHHIKPLKVFIKEYEIKTVEEAINCESLWKVENGLTLCKQCHKETDGFCVPN